MLGGTKSDKYGGKWGGPPEETEFIGQYFDASEDKWKPLNYAEGLILNQMPFLRFKPEMDQKVG